MLLQQNSLLHKVAISPIVSYPIKLETAPQNVYQCALNADAIFNQLN